MKNLLRECYKFLIKNVPFFSVGIDYLVILNNYTLKRLFSIVFFVALFILFIVLAMIARVFAKRKFDVGLGPMPLINNIYHKKALEKYNYSARTFVIDTYFITKDFDFRFDKKYPHASFKAIAVFCHTIWSYRILYTYFNGTMLYIRNAPVFMQRTLFKLEPKLYKLAGLKVVVMPYGGDVHDLSHCYNLPMKNSIIKDYPFFQKQWRDTIRLSTDAWTKSSDHIISGCDWVWFNYHWDTLLSGHFSIDVKAVKPSKARDLKKGDLIKVFHAPNHKTIKGSSHFIKAVEELQQEDYNIELVMVQGKPNAEILRIMSECDIVADQLIIGWYAMTAIEAMSLEKPVMCFLHPDLVDLYEEQGIIHEDELPIVNCNFRNVKAVFKELLDNPGEIAKIGKESRKFVEKHHSLEVMGKVFDGINKPLLTGK